MSDERERLIEQAASAHRPVSPDGVLRPSPAWADLDEAGREEAFERASLDRRLEAALDPAGLSSTARCVLARVRGTLPP